jgi:hypothetical protein
LDRALEMAKKSGEQDLEAGTLNAIGQAFANLRDHDRALDRHNSALSGHQESGNEGPNQEVLRNIAGLSASKNR